MNNSYSMYVRTRNADGLLLWQNSGLTLRGDYFGAALRDGYVSFGFNLGKQSAFNEETSKIHVADGRWHMISVIRYNSQNVL